MGVGVQLALGPVDAVVGGRLVDLGSPKQRALFGLLLSQVDRPVSVDALLEELWSGDPPAAATASLQAYVSNLRRALEPHRVPRAPATVLRTRAPGYLLDSANAEFDVYRFTRYADAGREALRSGEPQRALQDFEAGLALWRGQAYADVRDAARVAPEAARLEELRLTVAERRAAALLELGAPEVAVAELEAHVGVHPLREHGCELLALALYRSGRQADALAVLRAIRMRLADELGIDPGATLQQLHRDILAQAAALNCRPTTPRAPIARPPPVADREVFVGREVALQRLADALAAATCGRGRVVLVAREPGIGKTGLLRRFADLAGAPVVWGLPGAMSPRPRCGPGRRCCARCAPSALTARCQARWLSCSRVGRRTSKSCTMWPVPRCAVSRRSGST